MSQKKDPAAVILLLVLGSVIFTAGCSAKVWRGEGSRYRVLSILFGLDISNAQLLFDAHSGFGGLAHYDVTRDGKRFIVATLGEGGSAPMNLVVNWTADLKK